MSPAQQLFEEITGVPVRYAERDEEGRLFIPAENLDNVAPEIRAQLNDFADRNWRNDYHPDHPGAWVKIFC